MQHDLDETIAGIRYWSRQRNFVQEQRKRMDLALGSFLRLQLGWVKDAPEAERNKIAAAAANLIDNAEKEVAGKPFAADMAHYGEWREVICASIGARAPFDVLEAKATKQMEKLAKVLPVWEWAKPIAGLGARSLAVIVAEAGDLSNYPKKGHLWKRMGLAVIGDGSGEEDVAQGKLPKTASKDEWIRHGYSPRKRSKMYVIGDVMVKVGDVYRDVFLARCAYEHARVIDDGKIVVSTTSSVTETWAGRGLAVRKITQREFNESTMVRAGHLHKRAQRYMEKRLLRDLLRAWKELTE